MEHLVRLTYSNTFFYAAVFVFAFGVILWLAWARFFPESDTFKKVSDFVRAFAVLMLFVGGYASVVAKGLDGVACASGRYSFHLTCYTHDESPLWFWGIVVALTSFIVICILAALMFLLLMVASDKRRASTGVRNQRSSMHVDDERPAPGGVSRGRTFMISAGIVVMSTLAWIATSLHRVDGVRKQVAEVLASASNEKAAVEAYLRDHGVLPEDNTAMGLSSPADLHGQYTSEVRISKGSVLLKFDESTADEHLRGRFVMLIAVRRRNDLWWYCASPDIDDKYLPGSCRVGG